MSIVICHKSILNRSNKHMYKNENIRHLICTEVSLNFNVFIRQLQLYRSKPYQIILHLICFVKIAEQMHKHPLVDGQQKTGNKVQ